MYFRLGKLVIGWVSNETNKIFKNGDIVELEDKNYESLNSFEEGIVINAGTIPPFSERYPIHEILTSDGRYVEFNGYHLKHKKINIIDRIIRYRTIEEIGRR